MGVDPHKATKEAGAKVVALVNQTDWSVAIRHIATLVLFAGIFFVAKGIYGYTTPPVDRAEVHLSMSFDYNGALEDLLRLQARDEFSFKDLRANIVTITRYDASVAPQIGVSESSWQKCSEGLVISILLDDRAYGPYCYKEGIIPSAFLTGEASVHFKLYVDPGSHNAKAFVTYKGQPIASKLLNFHIPTYEEALSKQTE